MSTPGTELLRFPKKMRSKLRVSINVGRLLHVMYIAVKNYPKTALQHEDFESLINDIRFLERSFNKELAKTGKATSYDEIYDKYYSIYRRMSEKGYINLIELMNVVWNLVKKADSAPYSLLHDLLGLNKGYIENRLIRAHISYSHWGSCYRISDSSLTVLECALGPRAESLSQLSVYLGELKRSKVILGDVVRLGVAARLSIRTLDAQFLVSNQKQGHLHTILNPIRFHPFLLRMQRTSYRKLKAEKGGLREELREILSETWIDEEEYGRIIDGSAPANLLAMVPSVSLSGGLCFLKTLEVSLREPLIERAKARVGSHHVVLYRSYCTLFRVDHRPQNYIFLVLIPFSLPRLMIVLGSWRKDEISIKPVKRRAAERFGPQFPTLNEVKSRR